MISEDTFFEELIADIEPAGEGGDETDQLSDKETFTRAEVEQLIMDKIKTLKEEIEHVNTENNESDENTEGGEEHEGE